MRMWPHIPCSHSAASSRCERRACSPYPTWCSLCTSGQWVSSSVLHIASSSRFKLPALLQLNYQIVTLNIYVKILLNRLVKKLLYGTLIFVSTLVRHNFERLLSLEPILPWDLGDNIFIILIALLDHVLPAILALISDAVPLAKEGLCINAKLLSNSIRFLWGLWQVQKHLGYWIFQRFRPQEKRSWWGYWIGRGWCRGNLQRGHCCRELRWLLRNIVLLLACQRAVKTFDLVAVWEGLIVVALPRNLCTDLCLNLIRIQFRLFNWLHNWGPFTVKKDYCFISIATLRGQVVKRRYF